MQRFAVKNILHLLGQLKFAIGINPIMQVIYF